MKLIKAAVLAGAAGGAAEIAWVGAYSSVSSTSGLEVARAVTSTIMPAAGALAIAPWLGIAIHMGLSLALGLLLAKLLLGFVRGAIMTGALAALACVWALNFLLVLPVVNPALVALMPLAVTLASKLLFGAALGWTLKRCAA
jgi:hypothetical protein